MKPHQRYVRHDGGARWHLNAGETGFTLNHAKVAKVMTKCGRGVPPPLDYSANPPRALLCAQCNGMDPENGEATSHKTSVEAKTGAGTSTEEGE
jgi:hypothetical protein